MRDVAISLAGGAVKQVELGHLRLLRQACFAAQPLADRTWSEGATVTATAGSACLRGTYAGKGLCRYRAGLRSSQNASQKHLCPRSACLPELLVYVVIQRALWICRPSPIS